MWLLYDASKRDVSTQPQLTVLPHAYLMFVIVFVCITEILASFSSLWGSCYTHARTRSVNIMKVYIERHNQHVEFIRFRKNSEFMETLKWEYILSRLPFLRNWAHCYPGRVATALCWGRRTFRDMTTSAHAISGHIQFGT